MWKTLQKSPPYFIKFVKEKKKNDIITGVLIGVTNYKTYWWIQKSEQSFLEELKKSNDGTEFDDESELFKIGIDMLDYPETLTKVTIEIEDSMKLLVVTLKKDYEKLKLNLFQATNEEFFQTVIQPLIRTVCDLRTSQHELREILKKKDKEIDDWRTDGRVPRRDKTNVYDDAAHMKKYSIYERTFDAYQIPELLEITKYKAVETETEVEPNTTAVKTEQSTSSQSTVPESDGNDHKQTLIKVEESSQSTAEIAPNELRNLQDNVISETTLQPKKEPEIKTETAEETPRKRLRPRLRF